jgi:hypothetical protein
MQQPFRHLQIGRLLSRFKNQELNLGSSRILQELNIILFSAGRTDYRKS